jgi:glycosyltransferase involved in cell wall biosynthesis
MPAFSAVMITYNEARDLPQALQSLQGVADEILVVDSASTDRTVEIAQAAGARVIDHAFINFSDQRNFAASQSANDWVFVIDADEALSAELRASLTAWKQSTSQPGFGAYQVARRTNYLGGWIRRSGWYPEFSARLQRRDLTHFAGAIHEAIVVNGAVGKLHGDLLHYSIRTLAEHYAKQEVFTTRAAEDLYARGKRNWRGGMLVAAPWTLVKRFVLQRGILDGYRGALIAWTSARYVWLKYRKLGVLVRGGKLEARAWPQAGDA